MPRPVLEAKLRCRHSSDLLQNLSTFPGKRNAFDEFLVRKMKSFHHEDAISIVKSPVRLVDGCAGRQLGRQNGRQAHKWGALYGWNPEAVSRSSNHKLVCSVGAPVA
jgi:hypothetical protein